MKIYSPDEMEIGMQFRDYHGFRIHLRGYVDGLPVFRYWRRKWGGSWEYVVKHPLLMKGDWERGIEVIGRDAE